jgi:hypothetical protein
LLVGLAASLLSACEGGGEGQVSGTLFLRGCPAQDPTHQSATEVPAPLPAFSLDPSYFYAELIVGVRVGLHPDQRTVDRLLLRMQRGSNKEDRADGFEILVHDLGKLAQLQTDSLASGQPGIPIVPPPLDQVTAPLPTSPDSTVRAALTLNASCRYPRAQPSLLGHIRFSEQGHQVGQYVAGEFSASVEDLRAAREQGSPPAVPDAAGSLQGWFRIPIRSGPASAAQ